MRRCFQCGQRTDAAQLTAVGDGEFCAACFRQLLASEADASKPEAPARALDSVASSLRERDTAVPSTAGPSTTSARTGTRTTTAPTSRRCLVCERDIDGAAAVSFLGGEICGACNAQMESELRDGERAEAAARAAAGGVDAGHAAAPEPSSPQGARDVSVVPFTPGAETRWCAGCERPMPGPGSYRVLAGEPYCAACVPFYSVLNLGARPRQPGVDAASSAAAAAPSAVACDCCGALLERGAELDAGFCFCTACFTSDRELALGVARARHRRKLEALRAAIDGGKKS